MRVLVKLITGEILTGNLRRQVNDKQGHLILVELNGFNGETAYTIMGDKILYVQNGGF